MNDVGLSLGIVVLINRISGLIYLFYLDVRRFLIYLQVVMISDRFVRAH